MPLPLEQESPLDSPCNCHALRQAARRVTQLYDHKLAPLGLRVTQYSLLSEVNRLGPISLVRLADAMVMDRATLGHNVRPLEAAGYLTLTVGRDRRSRDVSITAKGQSILAQAKPLWRDAQASFETEIGTDEASHLRAMLNRVAGGTFAPA
jgi:DNA-binding MarR family transcriptional regulator